MANEITPQRQVPDIIEFMEPKQIEFCTYNECLSGHRWPPVITLVPCGGCSSAVLAIQKTQCPFCNEPVTHTSIRSDFVPKGSGLAQRCKGQNVYGETLNVEIVRHEWQATEAKSHELFEAKQTKERSDPAWKEIV